MDTGARRSIRAALAVLAIGVPLGACSVFEAPRETRGALFDPEVIKELVPGVQTRRDVLALLGTPTVTPAFDDLTWYYVGAITKRRIARHEGLLEQDVVAISFTLEGTIEKVEQLTLADAQRVTLVSRETPTPGTERNVLQQLFGNIGRFTTPTPQRSGQ